MPVDPRMEMVSTDGSRPALAAPRLLVIMPALNEEATIADVIGRIPSSIDGVGSIEVVVVDDGSTRI